MNAAFVILGALAVAVGGYRWYAGYIDRKVMEADPNGSPRPRCTWMGWTSCPPPKTSSSATSSRASPAPPRWSGPSSPCNGAGCRPSCGSFWGSLFIGWVHDYISGMVSLRNDGLSLGGLELQAHLSPGPRHPALLYLFLPAAHCRGLRRGHRRGPDQAAFRSAGHPDPGRRRGSGGPDDLPLAGQHPGDHRRLCRPGPGGHQAGRDVSRRHCSWGSLAQSKLIWGIFAVAFCYFSAVLPIWRFALPLNYVAFYIVMLGLVGGIVGIFVGHARRSRPRPITQFTIGIGPLWPILFVTIACGACSGWHSMVSTSGTCRQLESETDAKPVLAGSMFAEMVLGVVALMTAAAAMPFHPIPGTDESRARPRSSPPGSATS